MVISLLVVNHYYCKSFKKYTAGKLDHWYHQACHDQPRWTMIGDITTLGAVRPQIFQASERCLSDHRRPGSSAAECHCWSWVLAVEDGSPASIWNGYTGCNGGLS